MTLVVAKLDRLSRDQRFIHGLRDAGVAFVVADMLEANTLAIGVMAAMVEYERELVSERTRAELAAAKARGVTLGGPNLHRDWNTDTGPARAERTRRARRRNAKWRAVIAKLREDAGEALTLVAIAERLNAAGYRTARGKGSGCATVHRLLRGEPVRTTSRAEVSR